MGLIRRTGFSVGLDEDDSEDYFEYDEHGNRIIYYCYRCAALGFVRILGERMYLPIKDKETGGWKPAPIPSNHHEWLQCHTCGGIYRKVDFKPSVDIPQLPGMITVEEENQAEIYKPQEELLKKSYKWISKDKKETFLKKVKKPKRVKYTREELGVVVKAPESDSDSDSDSDETEAEDDRSEKDFPHEFE